MSSGDVLVAVEDPTHVQQLVRTAGDLARLGSGTVRLVTVVVKPHDSPFGVFDDETIRRDFSGDSKDLLDRAEPPEGVTIERDVVIGRSITKGLVRAVEESDPVALVVGWQGPTSRTDAILGSTVDSLVERIPCDLYVERVGREADGVESVLLPVAGGPHVQTAAKAAAAIAYGNDATVAVMTVETPDSEDNSGTAFVSEGREAVTAFTGDIDVDAIVRQSDDIADAIATEAQSHDVIVLAATRKGPLRRRVVGSIPRRVVDRTDETVVLSRSGSVVRGPLGRLGGFLRR